MREGRNLVYIERDGLDKNKLHYIGTELQFVIYWCLIHSNVYVGKGYTTKELSGTILQEALDCHPKISASAW